MKTTPELIRAAASAIANARGGRRGAPAVANILDFLPPKLRDEVMEDAEAVLLAVGDSIQERFRRLCREIYLAVEADVDGAEGHGITAALANRVAGVLAEFEGGYDRKPSAESELSLREACIRLLECETVQKSWPLTGAERAAAPKDTHSTAVCPHVPFRRLLAIHAALIKP